MSSSTAAADFTNVANWQGEDDEPTAGSDNLIKSGGVYDSISEIKGVDTTSADFTSATIGTGWVDRIVPFKLKSGYRYKFEVESSVPGDITELGLFARIISTDSSTQVRIANYPRTPYEVEFTPENDYNYLRVQASTVRAQAIYTVKVTNLSTNNLAILDKQVKEKASITSLTQETIRATLAETNLDKKIDGIAGFTALSFDFSDKTIGTEWAEVVLPYKLTSGGKYRFIINSNVEGDVSQVGIFAKQTTSSSSVRIANFAVTPYTCEYTSDADYNYLRVQVSKIRAQAIYTVDVIDLDSLNLITLNDKIENNTSTLNTEINELSANVYGTTNLSFDFSNATIGTEWVNRVVPYKCEVGKRYKITLVSNIEGDISQVGIFGRENQTSTPVNDKLAEYAITPYTVEFVAQHNYNYINMVVSTVRAQAIYTLTIENITDNNFSSLNNKIEQETLGKFDITDIRAKKLLGIETNGNISSFKKNIGGKFRYSQKVVFPDDVHFTTGDYKIFKISGGGATLELKLAKALSSIKTSSKGTDPICPMPVYNAGLKLYVNGNLYHETDTSEPYFRPDGWRRDFMLGDDTMTIRFKGDCSVASNQDIRLKIDSENISIYHANLNTNIATFAKSSYDTLEDLYEALLAATSTGEILQDFEVNWLSLDKFTPSDLIPCDVALVAEYWRDNQGTTTAYDAFPFYFTACEKDKEYTIDVIFDTSTNRAIQVLLNGHWVGYSGSSEMLNNECIFEINNGDGGIITKEITLDSTAQSDYPNLRVFYYEGIKEGLDYQGLLASQKRVAGTAKHFRDFNYSFIKMEDILKYLDGETIPTSKKLYHISHDDSASMVVFNQSIRDTYLMNKIYPTIAWFMDNTVYTDSQKELLRAVEGIGFTHAIHSGVLSKTTSISYLSYTDMVNDIEGAINDYVSLFGVYPIVWNNHTGIINYNTSKYLRHKGFSLIQATNGFGGLTSINRYCFPHYLFTDNYRDYSGEATTILKNYTNYNLEL
jgi:hypothetical protein